MGRELEYWNDNDMLKDFFVISVPDSGRNRLENTCQFHFGLNVEGYCDDVAITPVIRAYEMFRSFKGSRYFYTCGSC